MTNSPDQRNTMFTEGQEVCEVAYPDTHWIVTNPNPSNDGWVFAKEARYGDKTGQVLSFAPGTLRPLESATQRTIREQRETADAFTKAGVDLSGC